MILISCEALVTGLLLGLLLAHAWRSHLLKSDDVYLTPVLLASIAIASLLLWFEIRCGWWFFFLSLWIFSCWKYLAKPSRFVSDTSLSCDVQQASYRTFSHITVWTSLIYGIGGVISLYYAQYHMAFLAIATCFSSSIYHLHCEKEYFNLDQIFATTQLLVFLFTLFLASPASAAFSSSSSLLSFEHNCEENNEYLLFGLLGLPVAAFLLRTCGDPADILPLPLKEQDSRLRSSQTPSSSTSQFLLEPALCACYRSSRDTYVTIHSIWHIVSGVGPFLSIWYIANHCDVRGAVPTEIASSSAATSVPHANVIGLKNNFDVPIVPTVSLLISLGINLVCNYLGLFPMD